MPKTSDISNPQRKLTKVDQRCIAMFDTLPATAEVSIKVLCVVVGMGESTAWRRLQRKAPGFPEARRDGMRVTRFRVGEIRGYLAQRTGSQS